MEAMKRPSVNITPAERAGRVLLGSHGHLMMIACCVPMLLIAVALVVTGVAGAGFLLVAVMCTAMMALMMGAMSGRGPSGGGDKGS